MSCLWKSAGRVKGNNENVDLSNWMGESEDKIRGKRLNRLAIPGSHDAGSFNLSWLSERCPEREDLKVWTKVAPCVVAKWAKTQKLNFEGQLKAGARYFDLRSCKAPDGQLLFTHGLMDGDFLAGIGVLCQFAKSHPKEIVILDFRFLRGLNNEDHEMLQKEIEDLAGDNLAERGMLKPTSSVWEFVDSGRNIVVIYHDGVYHPKFWPDNWISGRWPNKTDADEAMEILKTNVEERNPDDQKMFMIQATLTPNQEYLVWHFCEGIEKLSTKLNQKLVRKFDDHWSCQINVVMYDFVEYPGLASAIIYQNYDCIEG